MRIERWHPGQLLIVWALTIGVAGWCFVQARDAKAALAQQFTAQLQELPSEPVFTFAIETLPAPRAAEVRRLARQAYDDSLRTILRKWQPKSRSGGESRRAIAWLPW